MVNLPGSHGGWSGDGSVVGLGSMGRTCELGECSRGGLGQ